MVAATQEGALAEEPAGGGAHASSGNQPAASGALWQEEDAGPGWSTIVRRQARGGEAGTFVNLQDL